MTITYLALSDKVGWGMMNRAAAICRHLPDVHVFASGDMTPLEYFDIPYTKVDRVEAAYTGWDGFVVVDAFHQNIRADVHIWRAGRPAPRHPHVIYAEPTGIDLPYYWPIFPLRDDEILTREQARDELGWDQDAHLRVFIPSRSGDIPTGDHDVVLDRYPAMKYLRAADVILTACGTNIYGEAKYLGVEAEWTFAHPEQEERLERVLRPDADEIWKIVPDAARKAAEYIQSVQRGDL